MKPRALLGQTLFLSALLAAAWSSVAFGAVSSDMASVVIKVEPVASLEFLDPMDFELVVREHPQKKFGTNHHMRNYLRLRRNWLRRDRRRDTLQWVLRHSRRGKGLIDFGQRPEHTASIDPAQIRFKVRGNTRTAVSVKPSDFMHIRQGVYLGRATKRSGTHAAKWRRYHNHDPASERQLGYNLIVQYPLRSWASARLPSWADFGTSVPVGWASLSGHRGVGTTPLTTLDQRQYGGLGVISVVAERDWTAGGRNVETGSYIGIVEVTVTVAED